ncbi:hypothetical protein HBI56_160060 [Parastagonospora nodorum]|uniref:Uncharacterized protein n=1 Tax=Phaeosphaeria nodorum (strain SN15 / ATCC MYA-4574 / FGSC 10173) TaxID=321614 RepID=A0A7U2EST9_PHANO|nr:hypothetical protein HBH56_190790 [Parastagonospora nodorum]QRC92440.1 hypothetical protein JI435_402470 [Parastagonospora nodorum SN15]KAH3925142.1 hypothetical protein HBH54_186600 [Parastagonospora nodorum]KAH3954104.1 hypothetical protein HBH53_025950 [Parastagonospora nodorum]KAH3963708.1 hypothetical protein HBH51_165760 [Parastagonospora nodorum]
MKVKLSRPSSDTHRSRAELQGRLPCLRCGMWPSGRWTPAMQPTVTSARKSRVSPQLSNSRPEWAKRTRNVFRAINL